jgi:hypothetical protein
MSSVYAKTFHCCLPIYILLGTIFILRITFCIAKLNNIGDSHPVSILFYLKKRTTHVPSILTAFLVFCKHVLHIFIHFGGILNFSIHFHSVSVCIESYAFWKSTDKFCTLWLYSQIILFIIFSPNMLSGTDLPSLNPFW